MVTDEVNEALNFVTGGSISEATMSCSASDDDVGKKFLVLYQAEYKQASDLSWTVQGIAMPSSSIRPLIYELAPSLAYKFQGTTISRDNVPSTVDSLFTKEHLAINILTPSPLVDHEDQSTSTPLSNVDQ